MLKILAVLLIGTAGQAPAAVEATARRTIAPFVNADVIAVVQLDLARGNLGAWRPAWRATGRPALPPSGPSS